METAELIFKGILTLLNVCALMFTLILVNKWHRLMEDKMDKIDKIEGYVRHVSDRNDIVYINQLSELQRLLINEERYEEADKIGKIKEEYLFSKLIGTQKNVINIFGSALEAYRKTGVNKSDILSCVHGKLKSAGGYIWERFTEQKLNGKRY